jgi:hypothetical protein
MTSAINPNNIDGTYPVAGQDNNSQGFRDNFTNIKTNFQYAEDEITDLQNNVVLKSALSGTTLDNDMLGSGLSNAVLNDMGYKLLDLGASPGSSFTVNYALGTYQTVTLNAAATFGFSNFPPLGVAGEVYLQVTVNNLAHTLTLPAAVSQGLTGIQGISGQVITFGATGTYNFRFTTNNGGSTVTVYDLNRPLNVYTNPLFLTGSEDLADAGVASLTLPVSYFSTGGSGETATLAAGTNGQIKTFAMFADGGGDMVITVTNPGWGGSGTITFADVGDACTLQYINSKWFCTGNNGCVFA